MKRLLLLQFFLTLLFNSLVAEIKLVKPTTEYSSSFAIVVDKVTYEKSKEAILQYKDALESEGALAVYILIVENEKPCGIKAELTELYNSSPKLEGAVFVGDIPIAMIRGAQHMTSAFKMNEEKYDWIDSSVPSDRFYDDLDLQFDYLKQDSTNSLLYYYRLKPGSPQKIQKDIYSGRIKAPVNDDSKYELIKTYLAKVVAAKKNPEVLNNAFVFTGSGYHSEALNSWNDEIVSLREQFPEMFEFGGRLKHINFKMSPEMKDILMMEMSREDLDMAIFHAHGADDTQYLIGYPPAESFSQNVNAIKTSLRSELRYYKRHGRDIEEVKDYYKEHFQIPNEWFEGAFDDSVVTSDSLYDYMMDMHSDDLALFSPRPEFIMFDECYNGSFHKENYISGRYIFGTGNVISSVANSVNVLQDKWANKSLGLLAYGVSVGNWHREINYLENHIIGDPTFHYKSKIDINLNQKIVQESGNEEFWRSLLNSSEPALRSIAIVKLAKLLGDDFNSELVKIYKTDPSVNVRNHVLYSLASLDSKEFKEILSLSINDPNEFIRRKSADLMGEIGSDSFIPEMIYTMIYDQSKRVSFNIGNSLLFVNQDKLMEEAEKVVGNLPGFVNKEGMMNIFKRTVEKSRNQLNEEILPKMKNDTLKLSKRINAVRILRNMNFKEALPDLLQAIEDDNMPVELRHVIIETIGWYNFSEERDNILKTVEKVINEKDIPDVLLQEAIKTKNRLKAGCNVPLTP
ncbi:MAG: HEAT repeat domain-containing protein [Ignavibacteria bacterium]|jgi:HEAT repeat protein